MTASPSRLRGLILMTAAVLVLSPDVLLISLISADGWTVVFFRSLLTAATMAVAMGVSAGPAVLRGLHALGWPGLFSGLLFGVSTIAFVTSVRLTSAANTLVIIAATPLLAALMSLLFLRERLPASLWTAITAGFTGILFLFHGSLGSGALAGDLLAGVTACCMAGNFVLIRSRPEVSMIPAVFLGGVLGALAMAPLASPLSVRTGDILYLVIMGTLVLPVPLAVMTVAPKLISAPEVSLILLLETFLGPLWVWLVLDLRPPRETVLGGVLLVGAIAAHALWEGRGRD